jgi:glycosyltransferase involved in cell wall biosynthesis
LTRVLQLAKFYPPEPGGIESMVREQVHGLIHRGWGCDVLCASRGRRTISEQGVQGERVIRAGSLGTWLSTSLSPALVLELRRRLVAYDLIDVHLPNPMAALALWCVRPRARIVLHWHSDVIRQRRAMALFGPLQHWLLSRADAVVATSQAYVEGSEALMAWRNKVQVHPLGIGDNSTCRNAVLEQQLQQRLAGRRLVFAVGRMVSYKGFDVLIDAASRLPRDVLVVIGGAGPLLSPWRERVKALGLQDQVCLPGLMENDDLMSHLHACDLFCLPSLTRAEAFGVVMLEAMAAGKPVVSSKIAGSGMGWVNEDGVTGLKVPPGDAARLAHALTDLLADPSRRTRMGQAARQRFLTHFTADHMIDRLQQLYSELLIAPTSPAS